MNNPFSILNQEGSDESVDSVDSVEFVHFESLVPDTKVKLPEQPFHEQVDRASTKSFFSQLTCSSKYGYFVAAGESGFLCGKTEQLYDTVYAAEKGDSISFGNCFQVPVKEGGIKFLVLSHDERQLIVGVTKGLLLIYHISDIVKERENTLAIRSISLDSEIISVHPNPEVYPDLVSVCVHNNGCKLVQITTGKIIHTIPYATSASWSPKGKQIVCGNKEGGIRAFDISGTVKDDIPAPQMANNLEVRALLWVENHIFLAIYGSTESPDAEHYPYIINRKALDENEKYQPLGEITPIYNSENADNQFYLSLIRDFGTDAKTMVIVANAIASDFAVIGQNANGTWQTWDFEEGRIPSLPLSENNLEDTFPVGIAVDFSASKNLPPFDASESDTPVPPMPIFLFLTNEGRICTYHIYCNSLAKNSERYSGMVNAEDVFSIQPPSDEPTDFTQMPSAPTPSSQQPSQPSQPVVGAFGAALNNSNKTPAFGNLANTKLPSFSGMRTTVPSIKPNTSAFGATQFQQPVFGAGGFGNAGAGVAQTSSFAALAKTSTQTSAGGGTFGNPPAFGSAFTTGNTPTFGSASTVGNTPTFGNVAAVGKIPPPAFGNAAITQQNPFGHFKSPTLGSAQQNPFGSFKNPALGNASTQQPAFGDVKKSAFTASSKFEDNQKEVPLATSAFASLNVKSPNVTHQTTPPTSSKYATHPTTEEIRNVSQPEPLSIESLSIDRGKENETTKQALVDDVQHEEKSREIHEPEHDLYVEEEKSEELTEDEQPYELDGLSDEEYDKEEYLEESDHLSEELSEEDFSNEYQSDGSEPLVTKQRDKKKKQD
ncbi:hypothetical protein G6F56_007376 [Rhizopus delemar]|nr:hypothetical protein G6F56_007376 [Rhizopus delemar]